MNITKNKIIIVLAVLTIIATAAAVYFHSQYAAIKANSPQASQQDMQRQVNDLVGRVGALMVLPSGEVPTVATVADPSLLKGQAFFANAVAGDKVLIYSIAGEAILYNPAANKIVNVAPINTGGPVQVPVTTSTVKK